MEVPAVHPTQIYELIAALIGTAVIILCGSLLIKIFRERPTKRSFSS